MTVDLSRVLTKAEREIYQLMIEGLSNEAIATKRFTSHKTTKFHITHMFKKFGVTTRYELLVQHYKSEIEKLKAAHAKEILAERQAGQAKVERLLMCDFERNRQEQRK